MFATFSEDQVKVYQTDGTYRRTIRLQSDVLQATVYGDLVCIVCTDGYTYLYDTDGNRIRRVLN